MWELEPCFRTLLSSSLGNSVATESYCPFSLRRLDLSSSAIVSLPTWFNRFVGLQRLFLNDCKQLEEIPELPPSIERVYANGCTSLETFQFKIYDLPKLEWIGLSDCHKLCENILDDLQICLMRKVPLFHIYTR
jgi:hypothetical protein